MNKAEKTAEIFKVLSDPTRLRLLKLLRLHKGALCVNALAFHLKISQSAVSQHFRVLRQAGFVKGERIGPFVHYSFDDEGLKKYKSILEDVFGEDLS
jgi:ArsR family transcriptional regulator